MRKAGCAGYLGIMPKCKKEHEKITLIKTEEGLGTQKTTDDGLNLPSLYTSYSLKKKKKQLNYKSKNQGTELKPWFCP